MRFNVSDHDHVLWAGQLEPTCLTRTSLRSNKATLILLARPMREPDDRFWQLKEAGA